MSKRVLVCGGRNFTDYGFLAETLSRELRDFMPDMTIIHGNAQGADLLAARWAVRNNIPQIAFDADWETYGRAAGPIRNQAMLEQGKPDFVIAFTGGRGTANMCAQALAAGVEVRAICMPDTAVKQKQIAKKTA